MIRTIGCALIPYLVSSGFSRRNKKKKGSRTGVRAVLSPTDVVINYRIRELPTTVSSPKAIWPQVLLNIEQLRTTQATLSLKTTSFIRTIIMMFKAVIMSIR